MAVAHSKLTLGSAPTPLTHTVPDRKGSAGDVARSALVTNEGPGPAFIGGPAVSSTSYGTKVESGARLALDMGVTDVFFAVAESADNEAVLRILHSGV